jgi:hypothetical protein
MRATALAFAFNGPRFIALLGPLLAGTMITEFGGFGQAAMGTGVDLCGWYSCGVLPARNQGRAPAGLIRQRDLRLSR